MAGKTYKARGLILRKTKLRESDAIVTFLDSEGERREAVAHGARRPGSSLSGRMELYSEVDLLCAKGRSLDVVSDSRLTAGTMNRFDMEQSLCAAPVAELLTAVSQVGLRQDRLYDLARASFTSIANAQASHAPAYTAAALFKICAVIGIRPTLDSCVLCGTPVDIGLPNTAFSVSEGGALCPSCPRPLDSVFYESTSLAWAHALLYARYDEIPDIVGARVLPFEVLSIAGSWVREHAGTRLKSLDVLLSCGLF